MEEKKSSYKWKFSKIGGVTRVSIESGDDIAHLDELDEKMWTVLSCPTSGLEFDDKTLEMIDADKDGKIRVPDVVATAKWITNVITNNDLLLKHDVSCAVTAIPARPSFSSPGFRQLTPSQIPIKELL